MAILLNLGKLIQFLHSSSYCLQIKKLAVFRCRQPSAINHFPELDKSRKYRKTSRRDLTTTEREMATGWRHPSLFRFLYQKSNGSSAGLKNNNNKLKTELHLKSPIVSLLAKTEFSALSIYFQESNRLLTMISLCWRNNYLTTLDTVRP